MFSKEECRPRTSISSYKGRYLWAVQSTCIFNATCVVGNSRKQHRNDPHGCYQDFTNKIASGVGLGICHVLLTIDVGCVWLGISPFFRPPCLLAPTKAASFGRKARAWCGCPGSEVGLDWSWLFSCCQMWWKAGMCRFDERVVMAPNAHGSWTF